jgi:uncharacterized tellurite resistance protein B-like protein
MRPDMSDFQDFVEREAGLVLREFAEPEKWEQLVACLVILVEVALKDKRYDSKEYDCILNMLVDTVQLPRDTAQKLMGFSEILRQKNKPEAYLRAINRHFDANRRQMLYGMVWKVIKADGRVDPAELVAAGRLGKLLQLDVDQEIEARRAIMEEKL